MAGQADELVRLNVGGKIFSTTRSRLDSLGSNMLSTLVDNVSQGKISTVYDKHGNIFIDRNPDAFGAILEYFRTGRLVIPINLSWGQMEDELDYFCIDLGETVPEDDSFDQTRELLKKVKLYDTNLRKRLQQCSEISEKRLARDWLSRSRQSILDQLIGAARSGRKRVKFVDSDRQILVDMNSENRRRLLRRMNALAVEMFPVITRIHVKRFGCSKELCIEASWKTAKR